MTAQPKSKLMARLRAARQAAGLVRVEFWLTPEQAKLARAYVARLIKNIKRD